MGPFFLTMASCAPGVEGFVTVWIDFRLKREMAHSSQRSLGGGLLNMLIEERKATAVSHAGCSTRRGEKATTDPSTPLRSGRDDTRLVDGRQWMSGDFRGRRFTRRFPLGTRATCYFGLVTRRLRVRTLLASSPSSSTGVSAMKAQWAKRSSLSRRRKASLPMVPFPMC